MGLDFDYKGALKGFARTAEPQTQPQDLFVNGWLGAYIGGQRTEEALGIVNKFLTDNPRLDNDLRLKILENADIIERAVKIRSKYGKMNRRFSRPLASRILGSDVFFPFTLIYFFNEELI